MKFAPQVSREQDEIQIAIYFPEWMKNKLAEKRVYMHEVEVAKSTGAAFSVLKPLDHVHILIDKKNGESLLAKIGG